MRDEGESYRELWVAMVVVSLDVARAAPLYSLDVLGLVFRLVFGFGASVFVRAREETSAAT